ncbi:MAG: hypothetical protein HUJ25_11765 [Crocinitomicaceae bacterium]|nr:hypothetical protein [Crocinitomicaceae bacterium]
MDTMIITTMSKQEFLESIARVVRAEMEAKESLRQEEEILKMHEVLEILEISKPTLVKVFNI